jgi:hypothetical protein
MNVYKISLSRWFFYKHTSSVGWNGVVNSSGESMVGGHVTVCWVGLSKVLAPRSCLKAEQVSSNNHNLLQPSSFSRKLSHFTSDILN